MNAFVIFSVLGILLALCIQNSSSKKCWDCRSDADPNCADPFNSETFAIINCNQVPSRHGEVVDLSACMKIYLKVNGNYITFRRCAYLNETGNLLGQQNTCVQNEGVINTDLLGFRLDENIDLGSATYCSCNDKDGCNSGTHLGIYAALNIFMLLCLIKM